MIEPINPLRDAAVRARAAQHDLRERQSIAAWFVQSGLALAGGAAIGQWANPDSGLLIAGAIGQALVVAAAHAAVSLLSWIYLPKSLVQLAQNLSTPPAQRPPLDPASLQTPTWLLVVAALVLLAGALLMTVLLTLFSTSPGLFAIATAELLLSVALIALMRRACDGALHIR